MNNTELKGIDLVCIAEHSNILGKKSIEDKLYSIKILESEDSEICVIHGIIYDMHNNPILHDYKLFNTTVEAKFYMKNWPSKYETYEYNHSLKEQNNEKIYN